MTQQVQISRVLGTRRFTGKDGKQRIGFDIEFKTAFTTRNGQIAYDVYLGYYIADDDPSIESKVQSLVGNNVQIVAYFSLRDYKDKQGNTHFAQNCYISDIYMNV